MRMRNSLLRMRNRLIADDWPIKMGSFTQFPHHNHHPLQLAVTMKLLVLLGLVLIAKSFASDKVVPPPASMEEGVSQGVAAYENFMRASYNGEENS